VHYALTELYLHLCTLAFRDIFTSAYIYICTRLPAPRFNGRLQTRYCSMTKSRRSVRLRAIESMHIGNCSESLLYLWKQRGCDILAARWNSYCSCCNSAPAGTLSPPSGTVCHPASQTLGTFRHRLKTHLYAVSLTWLNRTESALHQFFCNVNWCTVFLKFFYLTTL